MSLAGVGKPKIVMPANYGSRAARTFKPDATTKKYVVDQASFADFIMREFGLTKQKIALTEEAKTLGKDKIITLVDNYFKLVEDNIKALAPFFTSALNRYLDAGFPEDESQDKAFAAIKSLVKDAKNAADMKYPLDAFQAKMANATMSI